MSAQCLVCCFGFEGNDDCGPPVSTGCGHVYHRLCITQWLEHKPLCPVCKRKSCERDLRRLYFNTTEGPAPAPDHDPVQVARNAMPDNVADLDDDAIKQQLDRAVMDVTAELRQTTTMAIERAERAEQKIRAQQNEINVLQAMQQSLRQDLETSEWHIEAMEATKMKAEKDRDRMKHEYDTLAKVCERLRRFEQLESWDGEGDLPRMMQTYHSKDEQMRHIQQYMVFEKKSYTALLKRFNELQGVVEANQRKHDVDVRLLRDDADKKIARLRERVKKLKAEKQNSDEQAQHLQQQLSEQTQQFCHLVEVQQQLDSQESRESSPVLDLQELYDARHPPPNPSKLYLSSDEDHEVQYVTDEELPEPEELISPNVPITIAETPPKLKQTVSSSDVPPRMFTAHSNFVMKRPDKPMNAPRKTFTFAAKKDTNKREAPKPSAGSSTFAKRPHVGTASIQKYFN
eukprot:TRINITY_DN2362_c1_g1_i1.p1 TRINITY_DN2362_c1_g1~~TRINITY_DN2362_c1_g1_i1.p1  ORF type:complete len:458 (-),score=93.06 TRINITY_DN2362_c1_g1_i1:23-1396(-)